MTATADRAGILAERIAATEARARADQIRPRCVDCGDPAWDTNASLCKCCAFWRMVDASAAGVK